MWAHLSHLWPKPLVQCLPAPCPIPFSVIIVPSSPTLGSSKTRLGLICHGVPTAHQGLWHDEGIPCLMGMAEFLCAYGKRFGL